MIELEPAVPGAGFLPAAPTLAAAISISAPPLAGVSVPDVLLRPMEDDDLIEEATPPTPFCNATHAPHASTPEVRLVCDLFAGHDSEWHQERRVARWARDGAVTEWFTPTGSDPIFGPGRYLPDPDDQKKAS